MRTLRPALALAAVALAATHAPAGASPSEGAGSAAAPAPASSPGLPVVGGSPAAAGRWNDAAAVGDGGLPFCTGTLIAPDLVLTAGHCITGASEVKLGLTDLSLPGDSAETIAVSRAIEHPDSFNTYDVGLLVLEQPSSFTPRVLATGCVLDRYLDNGAPVAIVGWGAVDPEGEQYTDQLMEAESTVTDFDCTGGRGCNASVSPNGELTAGGNNVDSCYGDSGGPLYLLTGIGEFLVGVTSRGYDETLLCGEGGIYVRPDAVIDWIEAESGSPIPRANCNEPPAPTADVTSLEVVAGESITAVVAANDPDTADSHVYAVATAPAHGEATVDADGNVRYTARDDYDGADAFAIQVADGGIPSLSAQIVFEVTVLPGDGCGCRTSDPGRGAPLMLALAALIPLVRRRGRRR